MYRTKDLRMGDKRCGWLFSLFTSVNVYNERERDLQSYIWIDQFNIDLVTSGFVEGLDGVLQSRLNQFSLLEAHFSA